MNTDSIYTVKATHIIGIIHFRVQYIIALKPPHPRLTQFFVVIIAGYLIGCKPCPDHVSRINRLLGKYRYNISTALQPSFIPYGSAMPVMSTFFLYKG